MTCRQVKMIVVKTKINKKISKKIKRNGNSIFSLFLFYKKNIRKTKQI